MRFVKSLVVTQYTGKSNKCNVNTCRVIVSWLLIGESRNRERQQCSGKQWGVGDINNTT